MATNKFIKNAVLRCSAFRLPSIGYCAEKFLLPAVLINTPAEQLRSLLFLPESEKKSQLNQDIFALLVNRFNPGFFLEIGANDGVTLSNTIYLEEYFGWNGLLVEANPQYTDFLNARKAKSIIAAIVDAEGDYEFSSAGLYGGITRTLDSLNQKFTRNSETIKVRGTTLRRVLQETNAPGIIDFISIDVEGAEIAIVEQLCSLDDYRFKCGCIEHNHRRADYKKISTCLDGAGYRIVWEHQTQHDLFFIDETLCHPEQPGAFKP